MEQLLHITNVPIKLEFETKPMKVEVVEKSAPKLEIEREKGGLQIKSSPNRDTIELSSGPHIAPVISASNTSKVALSTSSAPPANPVSKSTFEMQNKLVNLNELRMQYKADKIKFNMDQSGGQKNFTPSSIEYTVSQYPDVIIEYIGDMIYAPPSANPNYEEKIVEE